MKRLLPEVTVPAAALTTGALALIQLHADSPESLLSIMALVVAVAFWARPAIAIAFAVVGAVVARAANDALWDCDLAHGVVWWGDAFASLFGHAATAPTFDQWTALLHPDDHDRIMADVMRVLHGDDDVWRAECRFRRGDGSYAAVRTLLPRRQRHGDGGRRQRPRAAPRPVDRRASRRSRVVRLGGHGSTFSFTLAAAPEGVLTS